MMITNVLIALLLFAALLLAPPSPHPAAGPVVPRDAPAGDLTASQEFEIQATGPARFSSTEPKQVHE